MNTDVILISPETEEGEISITSLFIVSAMEPSSSIIDTVFTRLYVLELHFGQLSSWMDNSTLFNCNSLAIRDSLWPQFEHSIFN
ncbi:hypothetical protein ES703_73766 [subsurface metagenome]